LLIVVSAVLRARLSTFSDDFQFVDLAIDDFASNSIVTLSRAM
jgi:hypothetical protein